MTMQDSSTPEINRIRGGIRTRLAHESAEKHVSGAAVYTDDISEPEGLLHLYPFTSPHAHARIVSMDLRDVETAPGVVAVVGASDVPGTNDYSVTALKDDRVFSDTLVEYAGQVIFAVAAETRAQARDALALAKIEFEVLPAVLTVDQARASNLIHADPNTISRGDVKKAIANAKHSLTGRVSNGGQEHFYLEGQVCLAVPREDGDMLLQASTQDPSAVQAVVARIMDQPANTISVEVRRLGGGFGGKETVATFIAAVAAIAARKTGRPAKIRLDRDDDMIVTGKRHAFYNDFAVGFDDEGRIEGIEIDFNGHCGNSLDQSYYVVNRAVTHADNCYFYKNFRLTGHYWKTHTVSAIAFRGYGSPQGMIAAELIIERIARHLNKDPLEVRKVNFYDKAGGRNITQLGNDVHDNILDRLIPEIEQSADYHARRKDIDQFNAGSKYLKKGLSLTPMKYGIGFGSNFLNQGGALLHVYADGSVHLNHGGIEMGQGLHTKVAQVVAETLQIDVERIRVSATTTEKVPNTIATAASSGTDVNAAAARDAAQKIKSRLTDFLSEAHSIPKAQIAFLPNRVRVGNREVSFDELADQAYFARVSLSATGFYSSPENNFNHTPLQGNPFRYFVYGAAVAEVLVDTLTGENKVTRVDILHDAGKSLNEAVDFGQLEGGFIQGMGWLTTEELVWDENGILRTHAPSTYKIPTASDRPDDLRMKFTDWGTNIDDSVFRSKAIGEPPLCLAICVLNALSDAVASVVDPKEFGALNAPATAENILMTLSAQNRTR